MNRLNLDFSIVYADDRAAFIDHYLRGDPFITKPPTDDELTTISNYILWGKDRISNLNGRQNGLDLPTAHGTWDHAQTIESLDSLMEQPTFNEQTLAPLDGIQYVTKREKFSRDEALAHASPEMKEVLYDLFRRIDTLDLQINYYELEHGKRTLPPREWLSRKFSAEEHAALKEAASHWNQFRYLKERHQLVELRREQYTIRDTFAPVILTPDNYGGIIAAAPSDFDAGIEVLPLGLKQSSTSYLFRRLRGMHPAQYTPDQIKQALDLYWKKKNYKAGAHELWVDFREPNHVYQIFQNWQALDEAVNADDCESSLPALIETLKFYVDEADISELQRDILDLKLKRVKNSEIAMEINQKWKKAYTVNYISTIFKQRIIPKINDAARYHELLIENLCFEENWKQCPCCKVWLLRDPINFTHRARSKDGFTNKCKKCEKIARNKGDET